MRPIVATLIALSIGLVGCAEPQAPASDLSPSPTPRPTSPDDAPTPGGGPQRSAVADCDEVAVARAREHEPIASDDVEAAERRMAAQQPARAMTDAVRAYGQHEAASAYGGLWLDGPLLIVAVTDDVDTHRRALRQRVAHPDRLRVTRVAHPLAGLEARRERLAALRDDPRLGNALLAYWTVNVRRNRVQVGVVADSPAARDLLASELGAGWVCVRPQAGPGRHVEPGGGAADVVDVPTSEIANGQEALFTGGVLRGDADLDGGCVWVDDQDERTAIVWPPGFGARFTGHGVELVDHTGAVVAREGDQLRLVGGGGHPVDSDDRCMLGQDSVFVAGSVTTRN